MKAHLFPLSNLGMSRDTSVSKPDEGKAFENKNIRITTRNHDTFLSVTNERGNKKVDSCSFAGTLIGWNKLNRTIILFTHDEPSLDRIYKVDYVEGEFSNRLVYEGNLKFSNDFPIESVVDYENDDIQKIYWVDGKNQLRFLNFSDSYLNEYADKFTDDWFNVNRSPIVDLSVDIEKGDGGNNRPNGTAQYFITMYNKHGQETSYLYCSPLVYLAPNGKGGDPNGTNSNKIVIKISAGTSMSRYDYIRVYALVRTSYNGTTNAYIVSENETSDDAITVIDDGKYLSTVDVTSLLYLGSKDLIAGTITHKDNTLFLGDITSVGNDDDHLLRDKIKEVSFKPNKWESDIVTFTMSGDSKQDVENGTVNIPYVAAKGTYQYENQLKYTGDVITTFKGGEKYRFAIQFRKKNGTTSAAYWIGDVVNKIYPSINGESIKRAVAVCKLPASVADIAFNQLEYTSAQLMIAQASYSDRSVKAQGIINPTLFNLYDRHMDSPFSIPSWVTRPRGGDISFKHFSPLRSSDSEYSEVQCSYWENGDKDPTPFMFTYNGGPDDGKIYNMPSGYVEYKYIWVKYQFWSQNNFVKYWGDVTIMKSSKDDPDSEYDFEYKKIYSFGGGPEMSDASIEKCKAELKKIYLDEGIPVNFRLTDQQIEECCWYALDDAKYKPFSAGYHPVDLGKTRISFSVNNNNILFSRLNRANFFVDEGVVTFNSPEIEYEKVNLDRMRGLKLRIVGVSRLTSNMTDYLIDTQDPKYVGDRVIKKDFSTRNISDRIHGILSNPVYVEKKLKYKNPDNTSDKKDYTDDDYDFDFGNTCYMMYLWHKSGSVIGFNKDAENSGWSRLKSKTFANLHFGYDTLYGGSWTDSPSDIRQCHNIGNQMYDIDTEDGNKGYVPNVDKLVVTPEGMKYPIFYSDEDTLPGEQISLSSIRYCNDPVSIKFRSNPHALISLSSNKNHKTILPYIFNDEEGKEKFIYPKDPEGTVGPFITWRENGLPEFDLLTYKDINPTDLNSGLIEDFTFEINDDGTANLDIEYDEDVHNKLKAIYDDCSSADNVYAFFKSNAYGVCLVCAKNFISHSISSEISWEGNTDDISSILSWKSSFDNSTFKTFSAKFYSAYYGGEELILESSSETGSSYISLSPVDNHSVRAVFTVEFIDGETVSVELNVVANKQNSFGSDFHEYVSYFDSGSESSDIVIKNARCLILSDQTSSIRTANVFDNRIYTLVVPEGGKGVSDITKEHAFASNIYEEPNQARFGDDAFAEKVGSDSKYLFVGELYYDYDSEGEDTRYGGTTDSAVEANTFIVAGPSVNISGEEVMLYGNQGDTYFQRWDSVKTLPFGDGDTNSVIDIASVMLETHINLDGRYDNLRGNSLLASLDYSKFGMLNEVYSQENNFNTNIQTDVKMDMNNYRTYLTWTEEKHAADETDKWTHITLASTLKLDGDKGILRALRRTGNNIIAFQDTGISEIMFNSRVQLATGNNVPVELANSGKVDGKRYISERNGCKNKWSIVSGKKGLYYVDDINKNISLLTGDGIVDLTGKARFEAWVREQINKNQDDDYWTPNNNHKFISFYDDVNSDVYFYRWGADSNPCLVFSEKLDSFSSFFDYKDVPMMTSIHDKFVSFKNNSMWLQNEGLYGNFFGEDYGFSVTYRVTPDAILDKIWTNIEYRSDFYDVLDCCGNSIVDENDLIGGASYECDMTFDSYRVWNEYQDTDNQQIELDNTYGDGFGEPILNDKKKFRIWRICIGRDVNDSLMFNRIRNPWVYIKLQKDSTYGGRHLMQLHDVMVKYFTTEDNNG